MPVCVRVCDSVCVFRHVSDLPLSLPMSYDLQHNDFADQLVTGPLPHVTYK